MIRDRASFQSRNAMTQLQIETLADWCEQRGRSLPGVMTGTAQCAVYGVWCAVHSVPCAVCYNHGLDRTALKHNLSCRHVMCCLHEGGQWLGFCVRSFMLLFDQFVSSLGVRYVLAVYAVMCVSVHLYVCVRMRACYAVLCCGGLWMC